MNALELIDELEDIVDKGVAVPLSGRCLLDKEELLDLIQEIKLNLPDDLKQAKWIKGERQRIIDEAKVEAENLIKETNEKVVNLVNDNEITKQAMQQANSILEKAKADAAAIMDKANSEAKTTTDSAYQYTDYLLENVEHVVTNTMRDLEQCVTVVTNNRHELKKNNNL